MNQRIKELALQAGFGEHWFEQHPTGCALPKPLMLKEYTESIVRECTRSLWTEECNVSDLALEEFKKNSKKIKQHFGVKE